jgi:hypothetical protein
MEARTKATLQELEAASWFTAVGEPIEGPVIVVTSWAEAIRHCGSDEWKWLLLEAANRYRAALAARSRERLDQWNVAATELKTLTVPLVQRKTREIIQEHQLPKAFEDAVHWDILHACMEAEYADVYPPGFFASQAYWYVNSHFPCGWQGEFPEGKLIIY